jgi:hypothetical protein
LVTAFVLTVVAAVRFFKDDTGRTVVERGLEHARPRTQAAVSVLALTGMLGTAFGIAVIGEVAVGPYASPYKALPKHLLNGLCDAPGTTGTSYGPCLGSPGYRAPLRRLP